MTVKNWRPELDIPSVGSRKLREKIEEWFFPFIEDICDLEDLRPQHLKDGLDYFLGHTALAVVNELAPAFFIGPTGKKFRIKYKRGENPILPIKINEMYGQTKTPTLCEGNVVMTVHLLNPAGRLFQITNRLEDF